MIYGRLKQIVTRSIQPNDEQRKSCRIEFWKGQPQWQRIRQRYDVETNDGERGGAEFRAIPHTTFYKAYMVIGYERIGKF